MLRWSLSFAINRPFVLAFVVHFRHQDPFDAINRALR
jgi:hypothetical protein